MTGSRASITRPGPRVARHRADTSADTPADLTALVQRSATGDQGAFAALYDATCPDVYGLTLRVLGDPAEAVEVVRASYAEMWRTATSFDPACSSAGAWVLGIARRGAVDRVHAGAAATARIAARSPRRLGHVHLD